MNVKNGINLKYVCKSFILCNKSQGSIAKLLKCDELLYYTFIILSAAEKKLTLVNIWRSYRQNGGLYHALYSP